MEQFFDDLWEVLRFKFKTIEHYLYSLILILLILLPYTFINIIGFPINIFTDFKYAYLFFYCISIIQIGIYGVIFTLNLFGGFSWLRWKQMVSFLSLTFLIASCSLIFSIVPQTEILIYFVKVFSLVVMLIGLKLISRQSMFKVMISWFVAALLWVVITAFGINIGAKIGIIDQTKYQILIEETGKNIFNLSS